MKTTLHVTAGSVIGRSHREQGKNNQDAYQYIQTPTYTIAIVADGCSGATDLGMQDVEIKHSEVGAHVGSLLLLRTLEKLIQQYEKVYDHSDYLGQPAFWQRVHADMLAQMRVLGNTLHDNIYLVMKEYFLFTLVGTIVTPHKTCIFSLGDGWYALNGITHTIHPAAGKKQPYLAYCITGYDAKSISYESLFFNVHEIIATKDLQHMAIGTDGVLDLANLEHTQPPGQQKPFGSMSQFWTDSVYLTNPAWLQNRLTSLNGEKQRIDWNGKTVHKHPGVLPDDTTLLIIRHLSKS